MNCRKSSLLFGRRTRTDILKDKKIRKDEEGGDIFEDYWTDSEDDKSSHYTKSNCSGNESDNLEEVYPKLADLNNSDCNNLKEGKKLDMLKSQTDNNHHEVNSDTEEDDIAAKEFQSLQGNSKNVRNSNYLKKSESTELNSTSTKNSSQKQISNSILPDLSSKNLCSKSRFEVLNSMSSLCQSINKTKILSTTRSLRASCNSKEQSKTSIRSKLKELSTTQFSELHEDSNETTHVSKSRKSLTVAQMEKHYDEYDMLIMKMMNREENEYSKSPEKDSENRNTAVLINKQSSVVLSKNKPCSEKSIDVNNCKDGKINMEVDMPQEKISGSSRITIENVSLHESPFEQSVAGKLEKCMSSKNCKLITSASNSKHVIKAKPSFVEKADQNTVNKNCESRIKKQRVLKDRSNIKLCKDHEQFEGLNKKNSNSNNSNMQKYKNISEVSQNSMVKGLRKKQFKELRTNKNIRQNQKNASTNESDTSAPRDILFEQDLFINNQSLSEYHKVVCSSGGHEEIENTFNNAHKDTCNSKRNKQKITEKFEKTVEILNENIQNETRSKRVDMNNKSMHKSNEILTNNLLENSIKDISKPKLSMSLRSTQHMEQSKQKYKSYEVNMEENVHKIKNVNGKQRIKRSVNNEVNEFNTSNKIKHKTLHNMTPEKNQSISSIQKGKKKCISTKNKSINNNRIRKSSRTRYAPLAHWRNERLLYRFESGEIKVLGIDKGTKEDFVIPKSFKMQVLKAKPLKVKKADIYDKVSGKNICINVLKPFSSVQWDIPASATTGNQFRITRAFETKNVSFGYIQIEALEGKPPQYIPDEDLQITVLKGRIEVLIQENIFEARERDMFIVPRSVAYSLKNISNSKAILSFVVGRFKFI